MLMHGGYNSKRVIGVTKWYCLTYNLTVVAKYLLFAHIETRRTHITNRSTKNISILYIVHSYNSFQKDSIEELAKYFKHIYVFVRYKPVAEISKIIPFDVLKTHVKGNAIDLFQKPKNISVYPTPLWYLPTDKSYKKLGDKHYEAVLKQIAKLDIHYDLIHSHFTWTSGYVGMKLKEAFNKPLVVTGHGYDVYKLPFVDKKWGIAISEVLNAADAVTTVSESNRTEMRTLGIQKTVDIIPNGVNGRLFRPLKQLKCRKELGIQPKAKMLLSAGNLAPVKGHAYLIKAMKNVIEKQPQSILYIIGEGSLKKKLQRLINKEDLADKVHLVGRKPHKEIAKWMNAADLFVLPSSKESFGVVQIEALACGTPVVATRNGGSEQIIAEGETGFLCKPEDPQSLFRCIAKALAGNWDSKVLADYSKRYEIEKTGKKYLNLYENLLQSPKQIPTK